MKSVEVRRPNDGWLEVRLSEDEISYLWERIKKKGLNYKKVLAGNIHSSFELEDENDWFHDNVLLKLYQKYASEFRNIGGNLGLKGKHPYYLSNMWVNYQREHEFNPIHNHSGIYSFVVWMKIPTDWKKQFQVPFLRGVKERDKKASLFEFVIPRSDNAGMISPVYQLDSSYEGVLLFFPASMYHQVYPFYDCKEERISISGNIGLDTTKTFELDPNSFLYEG